MPVCLPELTTVKVVAIDTETWDPLLTTEGPGFVYDNAKVIGVSYATDTGDYGYLPLLHKEGNTDMPVKLWLKTLLSDPDKTVVMANARYDVEALWSMGIEIKCKIEDIQVLDALLNESQKSYTLDSISKRRGFEGKNKKEMEDALPKNSKGDPDYTRLAELPPSIVGPYAEADALLTLGCYNQQKLDIIKDELEVVAELESSIIPILMRMRIEGIRVNVSNSETINEGLKASNAELLKKIWEVSPDLNPMSTAELGELLRSRGHEVPQTEKENDSVKNDFLMTLTDPLAKIILEYRQTEKIRRDFIEGMIIKGSYKGRLHPQWFQTRGSSFMSGDDTGGTRSGRIGCMNPNLSQIPSRHKVLGPLTRSQFLPDEGDLWWKGDYSQQEPRITLNYAYQLKLPGAAEMRQAYIDNLELDYHQLTADRINQVSIHHIDRGKGKDINLGLAYGLGKKKMADKLRLKMSEAAAIVSDYHEGMPFMAPLMQRAMDLATNRGYVKTVLGRKRRFDEWEPIYFQRGKFAIQGYQAAVKAYGKVRRSGIHRALNSIVQGSAAEQMKMTMVQIAREGYKPRITLYDELGISISNESPEQVAKDSARLREIMETSIKFEVPHYIKPVIGNNWGEVKG